MAAISTVLARLKRDPLDDLPLAQHLEQLLSQSGLVWRERLLTPLVTLRLFMIQILSGNCAITALRQLSGIDFAPSSYCEARGRLPLQLLQSLLHWMHEQAQQKLGAALPMIGGRILIADGSTYSLKDTPELAEHFHLARGTKEGVGYPMGKLMGLLDAATGMFVSLLALPLFQHDMRSVIYLHPMLCQGDILLASAVSSAERETGPFAPSRIWCCSMPEACSPASGFISAARTSHLECNDGRSNQTCPRG
jgi:hypothetical protein